MGQFNPQTPIIKSKDQELLLKTLIWDLAEQSTDYTSEELTKELERLGDSQLQHMDIGQLSFNLFSIIGKYLK